MLLAYFFLALIISFLCSLLESVILSVTYSHIRVLIKERLRSGHLLEALKENINRPLTAILTLNTTAHTVGAAGVGAEALRLFGSSWVAIASGILTLSILVFSEIIPKTLGAVYWKRLAGPSAYSIKILIGLTYPFVYLFEKLGHLLKSKRRGTKVTREEMIVMAELGEDEGTIEAKEGTVIENLLRLNNIPALDVLTPRSVIFALQKDLTVGQVLEEHRDLTFSRIPVYGKDLDDIVGLVHRHKLIKAQAEDKFDLPLESLVDSIHVVNGSDSVAAILDEFVSRREHLFMVRDEFGSTVGLITLEDAIETLLGVEIVDESDSVEDMRKLALDQFRRKHPTGG